MICTTYFLTFFSELIPPTGITNIYILATNYTMFHSRPFNLDNSFIKLFARCANIFIYVNPGLLFWILNQQLIQVTGSGYCYQTPAKQVGGSVLLGVHRGIRWRALTEGYNYTQCSQGNLLFFHYKSQEDKDLQEREGGLFAVSFSEKSSLPLPK
jgi:hypothetical protein